MANSVLFYDFTRSANELGFGHRGMGRLRLKRG